MSKIMSLAFKLGGIRENSFVAGKYVQYQLTSLVAGQRPGLELKPGLAAKLVHCLLNIHVPLARDQRATDQSSSPYCLSLTVER